MGLFTIKIPDLDDPDPGTVQGILVFLDIGWQKFTGPGNFSTPWVQSFPKNFQHRFSPPSSNRPSLMEHSERWEMKFDSNQPLMLALPPESSVSTPSQLSLELLKVELKELTDSFCRYTSRFKYFQGRI